MRGSLFSIVTILIFAFILVMFGACNSTSKKVSDKESVQKSKSAKDNQKTNKLKSPKKSSEAEAAAFWNGQLPEAKIDVEIMEGLQALVENCKEIKKNGCVVYKCGDHMKKFDTLLSKKTTVAALETLSAVLGSDNDKLVTVACHRLGNKFDKLDYSKTEASGISTETVRRLLEALKNLEGCRATSVAKPALQAATLLGIQDRAYEVIEAHPATFMKAATYPLIMYFGRLGTFPKVQDVVKSDPEPKVRAAAFEAVLNMPKPTAEEKAVVCPWGETYIKDADLALASKAARLMVICGGSYVERLLDEGERRVKNREFKMPFSQQFREICFRGFLGTDIVQAKKICERNYQFLEKVVNNDTVDAKVRGQSLWNIYYQRRDQQSLDLMVSYLKHPVREVRKSAFDGAKSLVNNYKLNATLPEKIE